MSSVPPANLNLNPNPTDILGQIAQFNDRAEVPLEAERQRYPAEAARLRDEGPTSADSMPPTATTVNVIRSVNLVPGCPPVSIKIALTVALWAIASELPQFMALSAAAKKEQWPALLERILAPFTVAMAAGALLDALRRAVDGLLSSLCALANSSVDAKAQATLAACGAKAAQAALTPVCYLVKTLYHLGRAGWSKLQGDHVSAGIEMNLARRYSVEDVCLQTASAGFGLWVSGAFATTAVSMLGPGLVAQGVGMVVFTVYQTLAQPGFERIKHAGGFWSWAYSRVCTDRRRRVWDGEVFRQHELFITDDLRCAISHQIIVDGLRHKDTGTLYERRMIERWIALSRGRDPMTQKRVTIWDYVPADVANRYAREIATLLGASTQPVIDT